MSRLTVALLILLGACGAPGVAVVFQPGDFALVEAKLKG